LRILASFNSAFSRGNDRNKLQFILKVHLWLPNSPESHIGSQVMHTLRLFYIYWRCARDLWPGVLTKINQIRRHFFFFLVKNRARVLAQRRCLILSL
jgi:hypothetical protein